jgi:hypothetical protein
MIFQSLDARFSRHRLKPYGYKKPSLLKQAIDDMYKLRTCFSRFGFTEP